MSCPICNNSTNNIQYQAREMMFGLREVFTYEECGACGCVHLLERPEDMSRYYSSHYYSFGKENPLSGNKFKQYLKAERAKYADGRFSPIGSLLAKRLGVPPVFGWIKHVDTSRNSRILDVGCGSGHTLLELSLAGYKHLYGIDPYLKKDIVYPGGVIIEKKDILDIEGEFDVILLNHVFEHLPDPLHTLQLLRERLSETGTIIIRIPVAGSYAWKTYRENWVQLDPPRHFFLHTQKSIDILTKKAGLHNTETAYDSTAFQFWGSEQYKQDIPLMTESSYLKNPENALFSTEKIAAFEQQAQELNIQQLGDQATFYITK